MSDHQYRVPFRQNYPTLVMGVEAPKLIGAVIIWVGMSIFDLNMPGAGLAIAYWIFYSKTQGHGSLKGGVVHTLWRIGLWADGKKYQYDPNNPDLYR